MVDLIHTNLLRGGKGRSNSKASPINGFVSFVEHGEAKRMEAPSSIHQVWLKYFFVTVFCDCS